jgi:putative oxidoreductase
MDSELLLLRGTVGPLMVGHGAGKLFGAFNAGYGIEGTAGFLESLGFRPGKRWAYLHGAAEFGAGAGLTAGLLTPLAGAALIGVMATASRTAHAGKGPWATNGGWEFPLTLGAVGATLAFTGPGKYSVDHALGLNLKGFRWGLAALALGLGSSAAALAIRRKPSSESTAGEPDTTADARSESP